jgi:hypothetical protein
MRARALSGAIAVALFNGCGIETITVPANLERPRAVVHVVLDPGLGVHLAIVTSTRVGAPTFLPGQEITFDSLIGPPINNARMVITGEDGDSAVAVVDSAGRGRYRFWNTAFAGGTPAAQIAIVEGRRYRLRVETTLGTITGETRIPVVNRPDIRAPGNLNVESDTLVTSATATGAAGYMVAGVSQFSGRQINVMPQLYPRLWLPARHGGDFERTTFGFLGLFTLPGYVHTLGVSAVDTNMVKFYIAGFDPFGDDTQGNTVRGGVGLFGSSVMMYQQTLEAVATVDLPFEGRWVTTTTSDSIPNDITLYDLQYRDPFPSSSSVLVGGSAKYRDGMRGFTNGIVRSDSTVNLFFAAAGRGLQTTGTVRGGALTLTGAGSPIIFRRP